MQTALGSAIPFYKRLVAAPPSVKVDDVSFNLDLPVSRNALTCGAGLDSVAGLQRHLKIRETPTTA